MRRLLKWIARILGLIVLALLAFGLVFAVSGWSAFGKAPSGERLVRMEKSAHYEDGLFVNIRDQWIDWDAMLDRLTSGPATPEQNPSGRVPTAHPDKAKLAALPTGGLRVTWFGHSTSLVEVDGVRVLTDPIWSERASPVQWAGPARWSAPLIPIADLPPIDAVVISHDHYDHLDMASVQALAKASPKTRFIAPLGVGAHLEYWGIAPDRISEVEWWDEIPITGVSGESVTIVSTPARHATGRLQPSSNKTFWSGYAMVGSKHRAWYSGDTGYLPEFAEIGKRLAPFDVTLIESGQYNPAWPDNHLGPEEAVRTHKLVGGKVMMRSIGPCSISRRIAGLSLPSARWRRPNARMSRSPSLVRDKASILVGPCQPKNGGLLKIGRPARSLRNCRHGMAIPSCVSKHLLVLRQPSKLFFNPVYARHGPACHCGAPWRQRRHDPSQR